MLEVSQVSHAYDQQPVLHEINLEAEEGEIICLLGPSGCGKTTLLRVIAGLEPIQAGDVRVNGASVINQAVHVRGFGLMFQDFALFPHLNVAQNVAFGLKLQRHSDIEERVKSMLALVGLTGFEKRDVAQLSGGEKQRVALARSLAPNPRLLMLDEPLGSLDAALREQLAIELRAIIKQLQLTTVYVTHDQQEAFAIADRIAVMNAGRIEQIDHPQALYYQPKTRFVAEFLGLRNIVPVIEQHAGSARTALGDFPIDDEAEVLLLHPQGLGLAGGDSAGGIPVTVTRQIFQGMTYQLDLTHESGVNLTMNIPAHNGSVPGVDTTISIMIDPQMVIPLGKQTQS